MTKESAKSSMGEQAIFTAKAHVFHIDPHTKRSWLPASCEAINVSFYYDSARNIYRIISLDGNKAVINSTITPNMTFTKTSQKFGQWSDIRANTVYGLGFGTEPDLNKFIEKFQEVKETTRGAAQHKQGHQGQLNGTGTDSPCQSQSSGVGGHRVSSNHLQQGMMDDQQAAAADQHLIMPAMVDHHHNPHTAVVNSLAKSAGEMISIKKSLVAHQRSQSLSGLQASKLMAESPKHGPVDKLTATYGGEAQLRYENDRLKLALAQSSANAKKWEIELQTLKNNNLRLTNALQESTANVEEWKLQLQSLKEENGRMRLKMMELEACQGNPDAMLEYRKEMDGLVGKSEVQEGELRQKSREIELLKESLEELASVGEGQRVEDKIKVLLNENENLRLQLNRLQDQGDTSKVGDKAKKAMLEQLNGRLAANIQDLRSIQTELTALLNTS